MGSLEEEKLIQMVHDFIESESPSPISFSSSQVLSLNHQPTYYTLQGILGRFTEIEMVVLEKVLMFLRNVRSERKTSGMKKWVVMMLKVEGYNASICKTSWTTTLNCLGGDYEYIDIMMEDENGGSVRSIIDIDFKSQFDLARPTSTYRGLSNTLPSVFVGSEDKLLKIISLICSAAKQSLKENGLHIPPWRRTSYMQSKWFSHCQKISTTPFIMTDSREVGRGNSEAKSDEHSSSKFSKWALPKPKPKRRDLSGGSGLTSQFSKMTLNCC